ncbi:MAG: CoA transferase, partial [Alphaproteobacteria bacterium]|nr:CoA transferase [Alphaproteobacteria bacterium]
GPVLKIDELHADPQFLARDMLVEVAHERLGQVKTLGLPVKFSETPGAVGRGAPILGQHTREVLGEYGYSAEEIRALIAKGAVLAD